MPTFQCSELWDRRGGKTDVRTGQELSRSFEVVADSAAISAAEVIAALATSEGIVKGASHPAYAGARCVRVAAEPMDDPYRWRVRADYSEPTIPAGGSYSSQSKAPHQRDPQIKLSFRRTESRRAYDLDGVPIVNSAGDPFDSPPTFVEGRAIVTLVRWYESWNVQLQSLCLGKVNQDEWLGFPPDSLLIVGIEARPKTENAWIGWEVSYTLEHKPLPPASEQSSGQTGGWIPTAVPNLGWNHVVDGKSVPATTPYGERPATPVKLHAATGALLGPGDSVQMKFFRCFDRIVFSSLLG